MHKPAVLSLAAAISFAVLSAANAASPTQTSTTSKGATLTDAEGLSPYTFDKDTAGKSACNGPCAANWPALKADASDQGGDNDTIITRADGSRQWACNGKPPYTAVTDQKAGDISGDGFLNGAWHLA